MLTRLVFCNNTFLIIVWNNRETVFYFDSTKAVLQNHNLLCSPTYVSHGMILVRVISYKHKHRVLLSADATKWKAAHCSLFWHYERTCCVVAQPPLTGKAQTWPWQVTVKHDFRWNTSLTSACERKNRQASSGWIWSVFSCSWHLLQKASRVSCLSHWRFCLWALRSRRSCRERAETRLV